MPARNYKAQSDLAITIEIYIEYRAIWLENTKPQNKQMHCRISPRRACMWLYNENQFLHHRLLIFDAKLPTKKMV